MSVELFNAPSKTGLKYKPVKLNISDWRDGIAVRAPNWLGDAIMALPAMYSLKQALPKGCGFFVLCTDNLLPLFKAIPWVSCIISIGNGHSPWTKSQIHQLRDLRPGAGMLFVNSIRSAYYFKRAEIKNVFGASNGLRNLLLKKSFKVKWHKDNDYEDCHQSYKYLEMAYALGGKKWDRVYPDFNIPEHSEITNPALQTFKTLNKTLLVQPGAAYGPAKRWPADKFASVCEMWTKKNNGNIIIVGAPKEDNTAQEVIKKIPAKLHNKVLNLTGKTSLIELMYVLKYSDICLCNDSGVMHLASSLNMNGVALFGSTDPYATGPIAGNWIVMLKRETCAPCFSRKCSNQNKDYACLKNISADSVYKAICNLNTVL